PAAAAAGAADNGGASPSAQAAGAPPVTAATVPPSATPTTGPAPATNSTTLTVTHRPLGAAPDAAAATIPGLCGGGTLYYTPTPEASG
ncbi:hypothetical protein ACQRUO_37970, partial [Kitasatospora sp. LaBMicrA B282]